MLCEWEENIERFVGIMWKFVKNYDMLSHGTITRMFCTIMGNSKIFMQEEKLNIWREYVVLLQCDGSLQIELQCAEYFEMLPN